MYGYMAWIEVVAKDEAWGTPGAKCVRLEHLGLLDCTLGQLQGGPRGNLLALGFLKHGGHGFPNFFSRFLNLSDGSFKLPVTHKGGVPPGGCFNTKDRVYL